MIIPLKFIQYWINWHRSPFFFCAIQMMSFIVQSYLTLCNSLRYLMIAMFCIVSRIIIVSCIPCIVSLILYSIICNTCFYYYNRELIICILSYSFGYYSMFMNILIILFLMISYYFISSCYMLNISLLNIDICSNVNVQLQFEYKLDLLNFILSLMVSSIIMNTIIVNMNYYSVNMFSLIVSFSNVYVIELKHWFNNFILSSFILIICYSYYMFNINILSFLLNIVSYSPEVKLLNFILSYYSLMNIIVYVFIKLFILCSLLFGYYIYFIQICNIIVISYIYGIILEGIIHSCLVYLKILLIICLSSLYFIKTLSIILDYYFILIVCFIETSIFLYSYYSFRIVIIQILYDIMISMMRLVIFYTRFYCFIYIICSLYFNYSFISLYVILISYLYYYHIYNIYNNLCFIESYLFIIVIIELKLTPCIITGYFNYSIIFTRNAYLKVLKFIPCIICTGYLIYSKYCISYIIIFINNDHMFRRNIDISYFICLVETLIFITLFLFYKSQYYFLSTYTIDYNVIILTILIVCFKQTSIILNILIICIYFINMLLYLIHSINNFVYSVILNKTYSLYINAGYFSFNIICLNEALLFVSLVIFLGIYHSMNSDELLIFNVYILPILLSILLFIYMIILNLSIFQLYLIQYICFINILIMEFQFLNITNTTIFGNSILLVIYLHYLHIYISILILIFYTFHCMFILNYVYFILKCMFVDCMFVSNINIILFVLFTNCLLYTSPSPRDRQKSRMPSSA